MCSLQSRLPTLHSALRQTIRLWGASPALPDTSILPTCALPLGCAAACEVLLWPASSPNALRAAAAAASLNSAESRVLMVSLDSLPWSASMSPAGQTSAKLDLALQTLPKVQQHDMEPQQHQ